MSWVGHLNLRLIVTDMLSADERGWLNAYHREVAEKIGPRVGKSAKDNDALTLRHAKPNDLWLHVRGMPGSHVLLRARAGEDPDRTTLKAAAAMSVPS